MVRYIDTRARATAAVFSAAPVNREYVRLENIDTHRCHLEVREVFTKNYEGMNWPE